MEGSSPHRIKTTMFIVFALALSILSFHGVLDDFAHENVVKTTNESIALFALSRGINATVSLFQESSVPLVGLKVGELLDPLNDAIERLSSVMVWAIGSLFLQRVGLEVASSSVSKWSFLAIGLIAITASLLGTWQRFRHRFGGWERFRDWSVRLFIYLAVFRFIVPVFAIVGFSVSHLLFDAEINKNKENLSLFNAGISVDAGTPTPNSPEFEEQEALKVSELDELRDLLNSHIQRAEALDARIQELDGGDGLRGYLPESLGGVSSDEQQALRPSGSPELDELRQRMATYVQEAEALDAQIEELSAGTGWRRYMPESLGGASPEERQVLKASELPELNELHERMAAYVQEVEALDAQIEELSAGTGWRRYLPESLGGASPEERQTLKASKLPELDELRERMATYAQEAEALDAQIEELSAGTGWRRYLPERLGGASSEERQALKVPELPELNELRERMATYVQEAEALDAQIEELRDEGGLRRYLPESFGGVSPDKELASAKAKRREIRREMGTVENQIRDTAKEELASVRARREEIGREIETLGDQIGVLEKGQLASAKARRAEISGAMEAVEDRIRGIERELLASAEVRREEVSGEMETVESQIRAVEEELECFEIRRTGEDCVSLLGKLSAMGQEGYARIRDLIGKAGDVVTTIVKLTVAIVVKNILLPIAFLMIAVKYALPVARYWARLTSDFRRDVGDFRNTLLPDTGSPRLREKSEGA